MGYGNYSSLWPGWQGLVDAFTGNGVAIRQASRYATMLCQGGITSVSELKKSSTDDIEGRTGIGDRMMNACIDAGMKDVRKPNPLTRDGKLRAYESILPQMCDQLDAVDKARWGEYTRKIRAIANGDRKWNES